MLCTLFSPSQFIVCMFMLNILLLLFLLHAGSGSVGQDGEACIGRSAVGASAGTEAASRTVGADQSGDVGRPPSGTLFRGGQRPTSGQHAAPVSLFLSFVDHLFVFRAGIHIICLLICIASCKKLRQQFILVLTVFLIHRSALRGGGAGNASYCAHWEVALVW